MNHEIEKFASRNVEDKRMAHMFEKHHINIKIMTYAKGGLAAI